MPDEDLTTLGGYRLVRRLGSGSRADVYLGVGSSGTAALKIYRETTSRDDIGRELEALGRLDSPHCVRLVDVTTAATGLPAAILDRVARGSMAQLLRERESLEAGEAVTLLAPIVGAIRAAHLVGVAHSRVGATSVHLGMAGEPVLLGFGHAELFDSAPSIAMVDSHEAAARDRDSVAALVSLALAHVWQVSTNDRANELAEWLDSTTGNRRVEFLDELESRLFDLAEPAPIRFGTAVTAPATVPARLGSLTPAAVDVAADSDEEEPVGWVPDWLHDAIMTNPAVALRERVGGALRGVRKPVWIAAASVGLALVAALALVPQGDGATAADTPGTSHAAARSTPATAPPATATPATPPHATPVPRDPVRAFATLLAARRRCIEARSVSCLASVDERGSAALSADTTLIRGLQRGGELTASATITAPAPALIERLGDSALVSLGDAAAPKTGPASALLIREEAGWRIRSYQSGRPARSSGGD